MRAACIPGAGHRDGLADSARIGLTEPLHRAGGRTDTGETQQCRGDVDGADEIVLYCTGVAAIRDDDHDAADVNMSFGSFQLRVKTAEFRSDDAESKVEAFYR